MANDLLTTLCLATRAPIALAPAMNQGMWLHSLTQENLQTLQRNGIQIFDPAQGSQACGDVGPGRMLEPAAILEKLGDLFSSDLLAGCNVLVTAGPTHEAIDPVRYISNGSSGKMGYAIADAARMAGAKVTLISGPVHIPQPDGVRFISVVSARDMQTAVKNNIQDCDIFISVAAVGDYRSAQIAPQKIHKSADALTLNLKINPDIVSAVAHSAHKPFVVGFAAETEDVINNAKAKLQRKNLDMIVANRVGLDIGMGSDDNAVIVITKHSQENLAKASKVQLAQQLIKLIVKEFKKSS